MKAIKRIDIKEFREKGLLQEANRLFFHPLGLALEIIIDEDGSYALGGIWDYRDDPEGVFYVEDTISSPLAQEKALYVEKLRESKLETRIKTGETDNKGIQLLKKLE